MYIIPQVNENESFLLNSIVIIPK